MNVLKVIEHVKKTSGIVIVNRKLTKAYGQCNTRLHKNNHIIRQTISIDLSTTRPLDTLFHELGHATEHGHRTGRFPYFKKELIYQELYVPCEELVAELTAQYLSVHFRTITPKSIAHADAYIERYAQAIISLYAIHGTPRDEAEKLFRKIVWPLVKREAKRAKSYIIKKWFKGYNRIK